MKKETIISNPRRPGKTSVGVCRIADDAEVTSVWRGGTPVVSPRMPKFEWSDYFTEKGIPLRVRVGHEWVEACPQNHKMYAALSEECTFPCGLHFGERVGDVLRKHPLYVAHGVLRGVFTLKEPLLHDVYDMFVSLSPMSDLCEYLRQLTEIVIFHDEPWRNELAWLMKKYDPFPRSVHSIVEITERPNYGVIVDEASSMPLDKPPHWMTDTPTPTEENLSIAGAWS